MAELIFKAPVTVMLAVPVIEALFARVKPPPVPMLTSLVTATVGLAVVVTTVRKEFDTLISLPTVSANAVDAVNPSVNPLVPEIFKSLPTLVKAPLKFLEALIGELKVKSEKDCPSPDGSEVVVPEIKQFEPAFQVADGTAPEFLLWS